MKEQIVDFIVDNIEETNEYTLTAITENGRFKTIGSWNDETEKVDIISDLTLSEIDDMIDIMVQRSDENSKRESVEIRMKIVSILTKLKSDYSNKVIESILGRNFSNDEEYLEEYKNEENIEEFISEDNYDDREIYNIDLNNMWESDIEDDSTLGTYSTDMTSIAYKNDPAIGRDEEIKNTIVGMVNGSVILVGEEGVGKTAIVEGLAYKIQHGDVPSFLQDKKILKVSAASLVSGCRYVGMIEERVQSLIDDVLARDDVYLFFDEIHTVLGTGRGSNSTLDIANILKPYIDRGQIKIIGATTTNEYDEYFSKDGAFRRRFEKIIVKEPEVTKLFDIVDNCINYLEIDTGISFDKEKLNKDELIDSLIKLTLPINRKADDYEYNPALVMSILKKSFGFAKYYDNNSLEFEDVVEAVNSSNYIMDDAKEKFKAKETLIKTKSKDNSTKILMLKRH